MSREMAIRIREAFQSKCPSAAETFKKPRHPAGEGKPNLYEPLDRYHMEIRLLLVKAGEGCGALHCELQQAFLTSDPMPQYETVSYCWGDPTCMGDIMLNARSVQVPASSKAVIARMRLPDADQVLWIDALCINQEDPVERGHQVRLMSKIYSSGQQNLVYLGDADDITASKDFSIVDQILVSAWQETDKYNTWLDVIFSDSETGIELDADLEPLFTLFSAPWFGRLWVVQEVVLSPASICYFGSSTFKLSGILIAAKWLMHKYNSLPFDINRHPGIVNAAATYEIDDRSTHDQNTTHGGYLFPLVALMNRLRDYNVTDSMGQPRDRVYAVLALHETLQRTQALAQWMEPDYSKPLQSVLRDAARFAISERRNLSIFHDVDMFAFDSVGDSWPSWLPHWHMKDAEFETPGMMMNIFNANGDAELDIGTVLQDADQDRLTLSGYWVDTVAECLPLTRRYTLLDGEKTYNLIQKIRALLKTRSIPGDTCQLGATLIAGINHVHDRATESDCDNFLAWSTYIEETRQDTGDSKGDLIAERSDGAKVREYDRAVWNALRERCFFVTASGYMGLGPRTMQARDAIAVLHGSKFPVVLRPTADYYRVLGVAYVYGIMDGEVIREKKEEGNEAEAIIVR